MSPEHDGREWTGRFVDVLGFEGQLRLHLDETGNGHARVLLLEVDEGMTFEAPVRGEVDDQSMRLVIEPEGGGAIHVEGAVSPLRHGGLGVKATYEVSAEGFSPLKGGIMVARTESTDGDVELKPEPVDPEGPS